MSVATLDSALYWTAHGISVIPIIKRSKLPSEDWRDYQTRIPGKKELARWFGGKSEQNIGIVCGGDQNLVVMDFDSMPGYYKFLSEYVCNNKKWAYAFDHTFRVKTPRGMHVYLKTESKTRSTKIVKDKIDIRSQGNMVVAPPSIHPSGIKYFELTNRDIVTIDSLDDVIPPQNPCYTPKNGGFQAFPEDIGNITNESPLDFMEHQYNETTVDLRQIKNFITILDFVSRYTRVKRTSVDGRWWMANCIDPNHHDAKPSLRIDTLRNRAKCLSGDCRLYHEIGLDVIDLYSILSGLDRKSTIHHFSAFMLP